MNLISRTITGIAMISLGFFLIGLSFFIEIPYVALIYGIPVLILGIFILFNKKEDKIEKIKSRKGGKK
jgi:hypothetical protein